MIRSGFVFNKKTAERLSQLRKKAGINQTEVAIQLGFSKENGKTFVSNLEKGRIDNPSMGIILTYLDAIGVSWITFFTELSNERDKREHAQIMTTVTAHCMRLNILISYSCYDFLC
jgi:transcriptional regulator with XRE-family HTH domain